MVNERLTFLFDGDWDRRNRQGFDRIALFQVCLTRLGSGRNTGELPGGGCIVDKWICKGFGYLVR